MSGLASDTDGCRSGALFLRKAIPGAFVSSRARFSRADGAGVDCRAFLDVARFWRNIHNQFSFFKDKA
jgi:hypothetical protein